MSSWIFSYFRPEQVLKWVELSNVTANKITLKKFKETNTMFCRSGKVIMQKIKGLMMATSKRDGDSSSLDGLAMMASNNDSDGCSAAKNEQQQQWFGMRRRYAMRRPHRGAAGTVRIGSPSYSDNSVRGQRRRRRFQSDGDGDDNCGGDSDDEKVYRYAVQVPDEDTGVWDTFYELPPHLRGDDEESKFHWHIWWWSGRMMLKITLHQSIQAKARVQYAQWGKEPIKGPWTSFKQISWLLRDNAIEHALNFDLPVLGKFMK